MKVYFYSQNINYQAKNIIAYLEQRELKLHSNLFLKNKNDIFSDNSLKKADVFIFFVKSLDSKISYVTAFALSRNKKVFFLLPKNINLDNILKSLQNNIKVYYYSEDDLYNNLGAIVYTLKVKDKNSLFNIKYTLRLSSKISDYLNWKAARINISGADWLRQLIQENMDNDSEYQKVLKDKYKLN